MDKELTTLQLTPEEAKLFILFQKHYRLMEILESADAFSIKGGFVTIHFDNFGVPGSLDIQRRYKLLP